MSNEIKNIIQVAGQTIGLDTMYEIRLENDSSGNPLYVWYSPIPNADPALEIGFVMKMSYDGNGFLNRKQMPDDGYKFTYSFDDRASYFS